MDSPGVDKLVERLVTLLDSELDNEPNIISKIENEFQITTRDAESALELTKTGLFRAQFISTGQAYPKSNLSDNPILKSALKIGLEKLGQSELYKNLYTKKRPWWKIW